jgi:hypothetical protein
MDGADPTVTQRVSGWIQPGTVRTLDYFGRNDTSEKQKASVTYWGRRWAWVSSGVHQWLHSTELGREEQRETVL